jgi:hypothetical protein
VSNNQRLIRNPEFFEEVHIQSLLTDFHKVKDIPFDDTLDAYVYVLDLPSIPPAIYVTERGIWTAGDYADLDDRVADRRYTLFGNMGLLFRYGLATLERYHGIYSLHASAMYVPPEDELIAVVGGPGAGKTVFLLAGIVRGYQIFSTEMLYFHFGPDGCTFLKGALLDNVRLGSLLYDYPKAAEKLGLQLPEAEDVWGTKVTIDLHSVATADDELLSPDVTFLFPRIEAGREVAIVNDVTDKRKLKKMLFDSATEKIGATTLLYESIPVGSFDTPHLMGKRLEAIQRFSSGEGFHIKRAKTILAGPQNCMEGI